MSQQTYRPSPAPRERVPLPGPRSGWRRVRAEPRVENRDIRHERSAAPKASHAKRTLASAEFHRRRTAPVVGSTRSALVAIQVSAAASDWRLHCRFRLYQTCLGDRNRWRPACGQRYRCLSNGLAGTARLAGDPVLEQRCPFQYRRSGRDHLAHCEGTLTPHPPSLMAGPLPLPRCGRGAGVRDTRR